MAQSSASSSLLSVNTLQELQNARIAIVSTEWNDGIVAEQIRGAENVCAENGASIVQRIVVPGSFELPYGVRLLWNHWEDAKEGPEAIIAFGAVIRGGTPHFEYVSQAVTDGILQLNLVLPVPVIFGVLTLDNNEQALERLGGIHGHKGEEAAITALKMIQQARALKEEKDRNRKRVGFNQ